jgi:hypothetical protein
MWLAFIITCIVLDGVKQVWVEWKRLLWSELAMAVREKMMIIAARVFPSRTH